MTRMTQPDRRPAAAGPRRWPCWPPSPSSCLPAASSRGPLFRLVAETGIREVFVGLALVMVVGIALLMQLVGLSAALGTFLAGVVLAESEYRHELEMDLEPFKGLLLAVFFIAVGAGIDFSLLVSQPLLILGLVAGFILIKLAVLFVLARLFGMAGPDASRFSFALAQGGEFAFVLISFAAGLALLDPAQSGLLVAVVAMSMASAPLLMIFDERVMQPRFARPARNARERPDRGKRHPRHHRGPRPLRHDGGPPPAGQRHPRRGARS